MKKYCCVVMLVLFGFLIVFSSGCKKQSTEPSDSIETDTTQLPPHTRKPNIYIYPASIRSMSVKIVFPVGGTIIKSIPEYMDGWNITVTPNGRINNQFDYLFYESINPDMFQYSSGWVVKRDSLLQFFTNNLSRVGFYENEIYDFIEYWIPRLMERPYYIIYPQFSDNINKVIRLSFSIEPDNVLRLFYVIKAANYSSIILNTPIIPKFERKGFVVTEWGVVM